MRAENCRAGVPASPEDHLSLCETLDRVLNKGVVVLGEVVISVADVDLIYLGLQLVLTSVETARQMKTTAPLYLGARTEGRA
ncbi:MAG TPA: gas vesicle protein [Planctomycetota bacterium]|nr:gas vesicle protein [Planctomycetota bacterium]